MSSSYGTVPPEIRKLVCEDCWRTVFTADAFRQAWETRNAGVEINRLHIHFAYIKTDPASTTSAFQEIPASMPVVQSRLPYDRRWGALQTLSTR